MLSLSKAKSKKNTHSIKPRSKSIINPRKSPLGLKTHAQLSTTMSSQPITHTSLRQFSHQPFTKPGTSGRKPSQAELIIQQHKEKQKAAELEKIRLAQQQQATAKTTQSSSSQQSKQSKNNKKQHKPIEFETPDIEPSKHFKRERKSESKTRQLPPGMTIEDLNKMSPEIIAKTLNIDMGMIDAMNDEREDEYTVQFSEDENADATPPLPFRPDPGEEGVNYTAARIKGRHTVNMMPSVTPRPATHKGRITIIRKLPPQFETVHKSLRRVIQALLQIQKLSHFDLAVTLVAAQGMQFINRQHRYVDKATDVLAFPMEEPYTEGIPVELGNIADLGEIILSVPYIYAQASIRHAMLRKMGYDLSDTKKKLSDIEAVRRLFASVSKVHVDKNGELMLESIINDTNNKDENDIVDIGRYGFIDKKNKIDRKFTTEAEYEASTGNLPSITLTSTQLDTLPPFDKEFIHESVHDVGGDNKLAAASQQQKIARMTQLENMNDLQQQIAHVRKMQAAANTIAPTNPINTKFLETVGNEYNNQLIGNGTTNNNDPQSISLENIHNGTNNTTSIRQIDPKYQWNVNLGFPPLNYFDYITESMVIDEMNIVLIHGFLHLCGYDHDTATRRENMQLETDRVVKLLLEQNIITQRCADLAYLYVLDEVEDGQEEVNENSENELLPAGLFMDENVVPMSDEQIAQRLKEHEADKIARKEKWKQKQQQQQQQQQNNKGTTNRTKTTELNPNDDNFDFDEFSNQQAQLHMATQSTSTPKQKSKPTSSTSSTSNQYTNTTSDETIHDADITSTRVNTQRTTMKSVNAKVGVIEEQGPDITNLRQTEYEQIGKTQHTTTSQQQFGQKSFNSVFKQKRPPTSQ